MTVRTELRIGEILALEWPDIGFEASTAEITKGYDYRRKRIVPPKNKKPRKIDLTPMVVDALKELRRNQKVVRLSGTVFADEKRQPFKTQADSKRFAQCGPYEINQDSRPAPYIRYS
ncbi:MAG: tyrosine-type recombinase/integrase [Deltaproteobacteria bacterium]|nr:MAG: tyrosine-type recombinase/integrase [Deltaproteobacteria bacterium]